MIEWVNVDEVHYWTDVGVSYFNLDRGGGALFRLRFADPKASEHPIIRIQRGNLRLARTLERNHRANGLSGYLKNLAGDIKAAALLFGLKPISEVKKIAAGSAPKQRNDLNLFRDEPLDAVGSFEWGASPLTSPNWIRVRYDIQPTLFTSAGANSPIPPQENAVFDCGSIPIEIQAEIDREIINTFTGDYTHEQASRTEAPSRVEAEGEANPGEAREGGQGG